jgi:hypothetical protein
MHCDDSCHVINVGVRKNICPADKFEKSQSCNAVTR